MKAHTETPEGPGFAEFRSAMTRILAVPKEEILRREAAYKAKANLNPKKRGPKPKARRATSHGPDAAPLA